MAKLRNEQETTSTTKTMELSMKMRDNASITLDYLIHWQLPEINSLTSSSFNTGTFSNIVAKYVLLGFLMLLLKP